MSAENQPPPQAVADLPVFQTLAAAFAAAFGQPVLLLRAAAGGLMLLAVASVIYLAMPNALTAMLAIFAPIAAYCHFGVNWYRIMLLGPEGVVRPALRWDRRHWLFFGYAVGLGTTLLIVFMVASIVLPFLPGAVVAIVLCYLAARCSFLFPTLAVEEPYSFALSWQHTKGQGLRLTSCLLLAAIPLSLAVSLIVSVLANAAMGEVVAALVDLQSNPDSSAANRNLAEALEALPPMALVSMKMIFEALNMVVLAVLFGIVALAFRTCTGWVPAPSSNLPAPPPDDHGEGNHGEGDDARF
ncbi:MAG: hypothetical protein ACFCUW_08230 [Kiloniellaceae bacterium]